MPPRAVKNSLRQIYPIRGGAIEVKITTRAPLGVEEVEDYAKVVRACERYAQAHPPESPAEEAERIAREANLDNVKPIKPEGAA